MPFSNYRKRSDLKKPFSCKVRKKRLAVQTKRCTKMAGNRRPNFGECGVMARNPLANKRNPLALRGLEDTGFGGIGGGGILRAPSKQRI
jgi:hypothetical protein